MYLRIMAENLSRMRIAILVEDAFEQVEMTEPRKALDAAGATTVLISPTTPQVQGWNHHTPADTFNVDQPLNQAKPQDFDALMLPGGVLNSDKLRTHPDAVQFVRAFADAGLPIAAICHGPWMLVESGMAKGRTLTSWPSLKTDVRNAGGTWVDEVVVEDNGVVTSRKPDDIPAFNQKMIELFAQSRNKLTTGGRGSSTTGTTEGSRTGATR